jgi:uncharacterized membrane protein
VPASDQAAVAPQNAEGFHTAMAHLYRAEVHRMTVWRTRLDTTSHWAVLLTTGLTTFTLGSAAVPHYTLLLGLALNSICILLEGRRYQHLHHSLWRLHRLEEGYLAPWLDPGRPALRWYVELAADLREPHGTVGLLDSVRVRLRRNYALLFLFTTAVWLTKLFIQAKPLEGPTFYQGMAVGSIIPSWFVAASASVFVLAVSLVALMTPCRDPIELCRPPPDRDSMERAAGAEPLAHPKT